MRRLLLVMAISASSSALAAEPYGAAEWFYDTSGHVWVDLGPQVPFLVELVPSVDATWAAETGLASSMMAAGSGAGDAAPGLHVRVSPGGEYGYLMDGDVWIHHKFGTSGIVPSSPVRVWVTGEVVGVPGVNCWTLWKGGVELGPTCAL